MIRTERKNNKTGITRRHLYRLCALLVTCALCFAGASLHAEAGAGQGDPVSGQEDGAQEQSSAQDAAGDSGSADSAAQEAGTDATQAQTYITMVGRYDSADIAPVIRVNEDAHTITFRNHDTGRNYTLNYDNTTRFIDVYGRETGAATLETGALASVTFLKRTKHLNSLQAVAGDEIWHYADQRNYTLPVTLSAAGPSVSSMATIGGQRYLMDVRTLVLVEGKEARPSAIVEGDLISAWGVGHEVYCVKVTKGHGYVRLTSDTVNGTSLVGAWIEIGNSVIRKITPRMLVTAPEGDYTLYIVGNGANFSTEISIERGRETLVDTSGVKIDAPKEGKVRFLVKPENAKISVDNREMASGEDSITLEYGIHTLMLSADGYETMLRYLRVGSPSSVVQLEMEKSADAATASNASTTSSSQGAGTNAGTSSSGSTQQTSQATGATSSASGASSGASATDSTQGNAAASGSQQTQNEAQTDANTQTSGSGNGESNTPLPQDAGQGGVQTSNRIYVDAPSGAAFYLDGNFIGFVPVSFEKVSGIHTVTLSQEGRRTVSYNIELDSATGDKTFNFPAMEPE